jgi:hypothetical protein
MKRRVRFLSLVLGMILGAILVLAFDAWPQQFSPGGFPVFEETPIMPGVRGRIIVLMPDGGYWVVPPKVMPEGAPAPYYEPPDDDYDDDDCCPNNRRHRRHEKKRRNLDD